MNVTTPVQLDSTATPGATVAPAHGRFARGFTIVEIMTVVGIILILVGIAAVAYKTLGNPSSGNSTKITLHNLQGMLAEYEAQAGLRNQPPEMWIGGSEVTNKPGKSFNIWQQFADAQSNSTVASGSAGRYSWDAVGNTQRVYEILLKVPSNKQAMEKMPSRQIHGYADETPANTKVLLHRPRGSSTASDDRQIAPPLVLDAWDNPIVFVGSQGLLGVDIGTQKDLRVTSVGVFPSGDPIPAGARPFFASAGPDGVFKTGEDNRYSFEP